MKTLIKILLNIGLSAIIALAIFYVAYNYVPLNWLEGKSNMLGTSITTILAGDTLRDSRTTINDNFTALNNGKIEVSTSTLLQLTTATNLSSIGTITTGTWNADILTVSYGGTGSTTLANNKLLLGNSTGALKTFADGTAGQLLTASSTGNPPYWSSPSIDTAADYTWTGSHTFSGATSTQLLLTATSTEYNSVQSRGYIDATSALYSTGVFSSSTPAIGSITIPHGLGVTPRLVRFTAMHNSGTTGAPSTSLGIASSTYTSYLYRQGGAAYAADLVTGVAGGVVVKLYDSGGSNTVASTTINSTNILLQFTLFDGTKGVILIWEAYK